MEITAINEGNLDRYVGHLERQFNESGRDGLPIFHPFSRGRVPHADSLTQIRLAGMHRTVKDPDWRRMWGAVDGEQIVGCAELGGGAIEAGMHRAGLMLGLQRSHYGRGLARKLLDAAFSWAREQTKLEWIALGVFATNAPAIALYQKLGFERMGIIKDRFRVDDQVIDEVQMAYRIER